MNAFYHTTETFKEGSFTLPGKYYISKEIYQSEMERIFYDRWLCVGRELHIPEPGDYFLSEIGQENIIIVRDKEQKIHAFFNICRHRGTRLCIKERGHLKATIQCPYHAWTYNLQGNLIGAPFMDEVPCFNREEYSLHEVFVSLWEGFIFINLSPDPEPFEQAFSQLIGKFDAWELSMLKVGGQRMYDVKANWKLIVQNYSECYHCPKIHPDLARLSPYRSGQNDLVEGPFLGGFMELDHKYGSMTMSGKTCALPLGNVSGEDLNRVYYYSLFPNTLLSLHPDYVMYHTLWPQAPDKTLIVCEWLFSPSSLDHKRSNPEDAIEFWDMTNRQDWHVCELSQLGVQSRAYRPSPYSKQESLLAAFDQEVLRALGGPDPI
jgi:glycine betaine catabolism A